MHPCKAILPQQRAHNSFASSLNTPDCITLTYPKIKNKFPITSNHYKSNTFPQRNESMLQHADKTNFPACLHIQAPDILPLFHMCCTLQRWNKNQEQARSYRRRDRSIIYTLISEVHPDNTSQFYLKQTSSLFSLAIFSTLNKALGSSEQIQTRCPSQLGLHIMSF